MFCFLFWLVILNIGGVALDVSANFSVQFQALKPRGLRITFPDEGFKSVTFNGYLNQGGSTKTWQVYLPRPYKSWWTIVDRNMQINLGDIILYNITLVYKNGLYTTVRGQWTASDFFEEEETPTCVISKTKVQCGKQICTGALIFSEDFSDSSITDLKQWKFEKYYPQEPDYPFNVYLSEAATFLEKGILKIKAMPTVESITDVHIDKSANLNNIFGCTGEIATSECYRILSSYYIEPPVISGKLTTRKTFNFKYGKIKVRAKLPQGSWLVPEINLEPRDHEYGKLRFGSGIIRIAFSKGNQDQSNNLYGGPVVHDKEPQRSRFLINSLSDSSWSDNFHTYAVIWTPDSIEMLVDGESYGVLNSNISHSYNLKPIEPHMKMQTAAWELGDSDAPFDKMFYISLGLRVGGIHDFLDTYDKPWKNQSPKAMYEFVKHTRNWYSSWTSPELAVDYVKVYAL